ncbi:hypothetical protein [Natronorubrum aibiense]|uniref:Uncharacterized protein n=1 Tax=Natronorubrum aibiense TaxID=348826 RepID=A0A5P9NZP1_9EURY|nr:hypothetical protein [Natronorubrum aibiense]QFU81216.1 hypothetical protein GCU68_00925 [Natronorubrum aibiense]
MVPTLVSAEFLTAIALLIVLIGVPLFALAVIAVVTGYIQHDADAFLEDIESERPPNDDER